MPVIETAWLVAKAIVRGKGHIDGNTPCQDACEVHTSANGKWLAAVVCDGAGSASRAQEGASLVSVRFASELIREVDRIESRGPGVWLKDRVHAILIGIREELRQIPGSIHDFKCTLVAVLCGPTGGYFFHIGDGAGLASRIVADSDASGRKRTASFWNDLIVSEPENGEFINETFFVTQDDWDKHLRGTPIPGSCDMVMLMSDGAMPFVLQKKKPYSPFIDPIIKQLLRSASREERDVKLHKYFAAPESYPVTDDDKTILVALRREMIEIASCETSPYVPPALPTEASDKPMTSERVTTTKVASSVSRSYAVRQVLQKPALALYLSASALTLALMSFALSGFVYFRLPRAADVNPVDPSAAHAQPSTLQKINSAQSPRITAVSVSPFVPLTDGEANTFAVTISGQNFTPGHSTVNLLDKNTSVKLGIGAVVMTGSNRIVIDRVALSPTDDYEVEVVNSDGQTAGPFLLDLSGKNPPTRAGRP